MIRLAYCTDPHQEDNMLTVQPGQATNKDPPLQPRELGSSWCARGRGLAIAMTYLVKPSIRGKTYNYRSNAYYFVKQQATLNK